MKKADETTDENCLKARELLGQVTAKELKVLAEHAKGRMAYFHLRSAYDGEDFAQEALFRVLAGADGQTGRRATAQDVHSMSDFLAFLRSTINSIIEAERRKSVSHATFEPAGALCTSDSDESSFRDILAQLFSGLENAAPHLQPLIARWRETAEWTDAIPLLGSHRRVRAQLRAIALKRLKKIAPELVAARLRKKT